MIYTSLVATQLYKMAILNNPSLVREKQIKACFCFFNVLILSTIGLIWKIMLSESRLKRHLIILPRKRGLLGGIYIQWGYHSSKQFRSSKRWSNNTMLPDGSILQKRKERKCWWPNSNDDEKNEKWKMRKCGQSGV